MKHLIDGTDGSDSWFWEDAAAPDDNLKPYWEEVDGLPNPTLEAKGGAGSGNFGHSGRAGHVGGSGAGSHVPLQGGRDMTQYQVPFGERVWDGKPLPWGDDRPDKIIVGKTGEDLAMSVLSEAMGEQFHSVNVGRNNAPVDVIGDGLAVEVKTGLATNQRDSQHWRVTLGESGKAEKAAMAQMTKQEKTAHNKWKTKEAMRRKRDFVAEASKVTGHDYTPVTVGVIMHPSLTRADVYLIEGHHEKLTWKQNTTSETYVGTFNIQGGHSD